MKKETYKRLSELGFVESIENRKHNKEFGISKSFVKDNLYCEIVNRGNWFSIQISGGNFQRDYYPSNFDVVFKEDVDKAFGQIKYLLEEK
ncbi:MAG: hypothetical protein WC026_13270 [Hyphomicrobium sp.]|uniref:hypothetical protein n=1 Tax=Hyphomicrobium sp. TaxID=82 RepID=UPI003563317E